MMKKVKVEGTIHMDKWDKPIKFKGTISTQGKPVGLLHKKGTSKVQPI